MTSSRGFQLISVKLLLTVIALVYISVEANNANDQITQDEVEMRQRLKNISDEKFSHHYHEWEPVTPVSSATKSGSARKKTYVFTPPPAKKRLETIPEENEGSARKRRDGGMTGAVATAVVTGMIGMTAKTVTELASFRPGTSMGGCDWFGTSPFCNYPCPPEYDFIRKHNGRCSTWWLAGFCVPDDSFGKPCSTVLGGALYKRFCCKSDPAECTWSGRWMGANTAHNIYCRYDIDVGRCGALDCSINHYELKATNNTEISGERCDRLEMFGLHGKATCGYIAWYDEEGNVVNSWYKTR